jgi:hypothetical protein
VIKSRAVVPSPGRRSPLRTLSDAQIAGLLAQSGCLVIVVIFAALLAGMALDRWLNTRPAFTLVLVLGSAPLTLFGLYRIARRALSKLPQPTADAGMIADDRDDD